MNAKKRLLAGAAVLALAAAGILISAGQNAAQAQGGSGPTVTIGSPLPLPINGTVGATQSGTWNVGITGIPSVNVGTPTVNLGAGNTVGINGTVQVGSSASSPVLVRDLDAAARHAFQASTTLTLSGSTTIQEATITSVPTGKRLVIESIIVQALGQPGQKFLPSIVISSPPSPPTDASRLRLPVSQQGTFNGEDVFVANLPTRLYVNGGTDVTGAVLLSAPTGSPSVIVTCSIDISGYLVDCGAGQGCPLP